MNKLVCGMVVDEALYDKYNWDKETGMRRIEIKGLKRDIAALKGKMKELGSGIGQGMAGVAGKINAVENSIKRLASGMRREVSGMKSSVDGLSGSFKKLGATIASVFAVRKVAGFANLAAPSSPSYCLTLEHPAASSAVSALSGKVASVSP